MDQIEDQRMTLSMDDEPLFLDRDPPRDPDVRDAVRLAGTPVLSQGAPTSEAWNADAVRATIIERAEPLLARLRRSAPRGGAWWEWTARWSRAAIPMAIAAGVIALAAASVLTLPANDDVPPRRSPIVAFAAVASPARSGAQLIDSLVGPATHEWILTAAVAQ
jgi:hypothetical protein